MASLSLIGLRSLVMKFLRCWQTTIFYTSDVGHGRRFFFRELWRACSWFDREVQARARAAGWQRWLDREVQARARAAAGPAASKRLGSVAILSRSAGPAARSPAVQVDDSLAFDRRRAD